MTEFNMCEVLSTATKLAPKPKESGFLYTRRLIKELAAEDFPADEWDTLPAEAQEWVNQQIGATNKNQQVDEVPGFEDYKEGTRFTSAKRSPRASLNGDADKHETEEEVEEETAEEVEVLQTAEHVAEPVEDVEEDGEAEAVVKPKRIAKVPQGSFKKRTDGKPSGIVRIKELLIEDVSLTPAQIMERLVAEEYKLSQTTVISCKADFKATVALLKSKGLLTGALA